MCRCLPQAAFLAPGCSIIRASLTVANIGVLRAGRAQPLYLLTPAGRFGPSAQVPTGHTLPSGASGGRRKVALLAQGCRIRRACQRGRPPAGSGQPVPRSRGFPSPNRRFGEGIGDSEYSSESCGPPNLPEGFFDSLSRSKVCSGFAAVRWRCSAAASFAGGRAFIADR